MNKEVQEVFESLQETYVSAGKKEEFVIAAAALQAGFDPERVVKYMPAALNKQQLIEQLAGMEDDLPKGTLEQFSKGKISAEDMRNLRLNSRGDARMDMLLQEIRNLNETLLDPPTSKDMANLVKTVKEIKKDLTGLKAQMDHLNNNLNSPDRKEAGEETIQDLQEMEASMDKTGSAGVSSSTGEISKSDQKMDTNIDFMDTNTNTIIEKSQRPAAPFATRLLNIFRKANAGQIERDEDSKRLAVLSFVNEGLDDDKLQAVSESLRLGVPYEHLRYVVDKNGSAEKIRKLTEIYMFLFDSEQPAAVGA